MIYLLSAAFVAIGVHGMLFAEDPWAVFIGFNCAAVWAFVAAQHYSVRKLEAKI